MVEHLSDIDVVRVLAFDPDDTHARALADHAAGCPACTARLVDEAQLELLGIESAEARPRSVVPPVRRRRAAIALGVGMLAVAAAGMLAAASASRTQAITADAVDREARPASGSASTQAPDAWSISGSGADRYTKLLEQDATRTPPLVRGLLRTDGPGAGKYGTILQAFSATGFAGKRVRFSADVATKDVDQHAALWLRGDVGDHDVVLDNMAARPIRGTTAWTRYAVVVDVPADVTRLVVGLLLDGSGRAVFADARVEVVGNDVPVTKVSGSSPLAPDFKP